MIQTSVLMPDEWLSGYFSRLADLNGCKDFENLSLLLKALPPFESPHVISKLALLLGKSIPELIQHHTLFPAKHAVQFRKYNQALQLEVSMRSMQKSVRYCVECLKEDCGYPNDLPYLRRTHQVTGIDWCMKHECSLCAYSGDDIPGPSQLYHLLGQYPTKTSLKDQHPIIRKYADIYDGLISKPIFVPSDNASWVLSLKANELGLNHSTARTGRCLSDILIEDLSSDWLFNNFPAMKAKQTNQFINSFDGVAVFRLQNHDVTNYVLAAAVLFETADEALNTFKDSVSLKLKPRRTIVRRGTEYWRGEHFHRVYSRNLGECKAITAEIGGSYEQNRVNLIRHGLPPLSSLSIETIQALYDFYNGASIQEIMSRPGLNHLYFERIIRDAGNNFKAIFNDIKNLLIEKSLLKINKIKNKPKNH